MFNIPENLKIIGLKETGCKPSHIQQCIYDKHLHDNVKYTYLGTRVSRGSMVLHTKTGEYLLDFVERNGWATYLEIKAN